MSLCDRQAAFNVLFDNLQSTNSRIEKETLVKCFLKMAPELKEDWYFILETLDGKHPIGWTFCSVPEAPTMREPDRLMNMTIKDLIMMCLNVPNKTLTMTRGIERDIGWYGDFIEPIVNRTLRLGIGKSLLDKSNITPMLAKKYEGGILRNDVVVTEKLDGNRCVAYYDGKWQFRSRSGKVMNVNFDMTGMNTDLIYDGEVMSNAQTDLSIKRYRAILDDSAFGETNDTQKSQLLFNETSGLINRHGQKTGLVYNIFDIINDAHYYDRRKMLSTCEIRSPEVRILPVLYTGSDINYVNGLLDRIVQMGGEGVMLNNVHRGYEHKRTDALLKYKQVQFMDMLVTNVYLGTGKYAGQIGGLSCTITTEDGKRIECDVGSGLSDTQRLQWAIDPRKIIGKIVQIGYHELTQAEYNRGTNYYSLRFPRLLKIRNDKNDTSEY